MIILVANHKGGVGKTFLSTHIFYELGMRGKKVALVDEDPQLNAGKWVFEPDTNVKYLYFHEKDGGLYVTGADELPNEKWEYTIVDTPPNFELMIHSVKHFTPDIVLIPTIARLSRKGAIDVAELCDKVKVRRVILIANNIRQSSVGYFVIRKLEEFVKESPYKNVELYPDFIRHSGWVIRSEESGVSIEDTRVRGGTGKSSLMGQLRLLVNYLIQR